MEHRAVETSGADDIDRFAEELQRNPERADDLKQALREKMGLGAPIHRLEPQRNPLDTGEAEDLWDNVPV